VTSLEPCQGEVPCPTRIAVLRTARLVLRAPRPADAKAIARLINDRRIAENTARIPHPYSVADARAFLAAVNRDHAEPAFLITLVDDTVIGGCGINVFGAGDPEPGYWLGVPYWGRGYASEAAQALVAHAFRDLGCARLVARARVSNPASRRVLEKCGFAWTGVSLIRIAALAWSAPADCFALDRAQWAAHHHAPHGLAGTDAVATEGQGENVS
jgi:RimJ/RimL family protein N-acetyltransferase